MKRIAARIFLLLLILAAGVRAQTGVPPGAYGPGGGAGLPTGCTSPGAGAITCTGNVLASNAPPTIPTTPNGVAFIDTSTPSGGVGGAPAWSWPGVVVNAQTGAGYTVLAADRGSLITVSNAGAQTLTVPDGGTTNFANNFNFAVKNIGAGTWTLTRTTASTFNCGSTLAVTTCAIAANQGAYVYLNPSNNWDVIVVPINGVPTLNQVGNPTATATFQPTVDAGVVIKQFNGTNAADTFSVLDKNANVLMKMDFNNIIRFQNSNASLDTTGKFSSPNVNLINAGQFSVGNNLLVSQTAPTIAAAGCGGGAASITVNNGTASFNVGVGTTPGSACTVTLPAAVTGWNCFASDLTTANTAVFLQKQTGPISTTLAVITNYNTAGAATAFVASDVLRVGCFAN
jgi:hypothetical protein